MGLIGSEPASVALQVGFGRAVFGAGVMAAPVPFVRLVGVDSGTARRMSWLARLFGVRDVALGVGAVVAARRDREVGTWLAAGAACDAVDGLVLAGALSRKQLGGPVAPAIAVAVAGIAGLGAVGAVRAVRAGR